MRRRFFVLPTLVLGLMAASLLWPVPAAAQWGPYPYPQRWAAPEADFRIIAKPRNAAVYVDGHLAGIVDDFDGTWQRLRVTPGQHEITLHLEGYRTVTQKVYGQVNTTQTLRVEMEPLPEGEKSAPVAAPAPQPEAPSPPAAPPGQPGWTQPGRYPPQAPPQAPPQPAPAPAPPEATSFGTLSIRVEPGRTEVLIDGKPHAGPPSDEVLLVQLLPGTHRLEVSRRGYEPYATDVEVRRGETTAVNVVLVRR